MIVRELTGDIYFGEKGRRDDARGAARGLRPDALRRGRDRAHRPRRLRDGAAAQAASCCSVDKANVLETSQLWRDVVNEVSARLSARSKLTHMYVDNAAMQLVRDPGQFDVIVTGNLFGDILSDQASMCAGSIGMLPSAALRLERRQGAVRADPRLRARHRRAGQGQPVRRDPVGGDDAAPFAGHAEARPSGSRRRWRRRSPAARGRRTWAATCRPAAMGDAVLARAVSERARARGRHPDVQRARRTSPTLVAKLDAALAGRGWEAIFVDDDSPDGTADAARELAPRRPARARDPAHRPARAVVGVHRGDVRDRRAGGGGDRRRPAARRDAAAGDARRAATDDGARPGRSARASSRAAAPATGTATASPSRRSRPGCRAACSRPT